jgi:hypothetical protein
MNTKEVTRQIISKEIQNIQINPFLIKENGCAACHVLFTLSKELQISEQDASDMLSETLFESLPLNDSFIEMVESIHMKRRMTGTAFAIKTRESKDKYIYSNLKNTLAELHADVLNYGPDIAIRHLLVSMISLEIAKNLVIYYHASTEELYYFIRKNDQETRDVLIEFMDKLYQRIIDMKAGN